MNLEEKRHALLHKGVLRTYYVESAPSLLLIGRKLEQVTSSYYW